MAGLFSALLLRQAGWEVDVFERNGGKLSGRGAGIVTHGELFDVLGRAGIDCVPTDVGVPVEGRRVFDRAGRIVNEMSLPQVVTSWGRLYELLLTGLPAERYHFGRNLTRIEDNRDSVAAFFDNGDVEEGDFLIGADGISSTVRELLAPEIVPTYAGYVAWRGLVDEESLSPSTRGALCDYFAFSLPPGEQMLGYPVAGADDAVEPGHRRFNFVWYRPASLDATLPELLTDRDGVSHHLSIPPNKVRPELVAVLRRSAEELLSPQFAEVVAKTPQPFLQVIQDLETPRMVLGKHVAILGDAAFVARPHIGMGVTKAAADAAALVGALVAYPANMPAALAAFEKERLAFGTAVVRRAQDLGVYLQAQLLTDEERLTAERHRSPQAVMAETAVTTGIVV